MGEERGRFSPPPHLLDFVSFQKNGRPLNSEGISNRGNGLLGLKKRGQSSRSWVKIDQNGNSMVVELDKGTIMKHCSLPSRDLRLLDPLFIYPSTILGREKAIVVSLEKIRCIIKADEVILMNARDASIVQYQSELCKRLQSNQSQTAKDDLPFEFKALELALELSCLSLDAQVKELEMEVYPVLDDLTSNISTLNLEHVRRLKGRLLALTQKVQKVCDEIEHLMDDDDDMAEMYLTEKKQRSEALDTGELYNQHEDFDASEIVSKSAPVSPVGSSSGTHKLQRAFSSVIGSHRSLLSSSNAGENIDQLEMLLEAYFVVVDNTLSKLSSLKEYIDDTEDLINIKLGNVQNQLIQFQLLLTAATFVAAIFAAVTAVFGMNMEDSVFDNPSTFQWVLVVTGIGCGFLYFSFVLYFRYKKVFPL
ncbi:PREDICTED: magnesium transporter MRS2-5 [Tarenaya hassleriana]|uniref:magnesium transporter MRS2-5 n=1 Tax=Tarenaya hassleriana TaxID=28532 RepID=UPI00053C83AA|nr:PREDICTED: magnesium transporter MRS2-5 [Tarenaya hassleriana]XP_010523490.1 PREDICTED: magnesium transporter MRS2-5 [Tarenaya hassleriana]XP_010523491.1 PREDICTED: magnesium transporter MRS2-5 [Tarenaya hassleriana]